MAAKRLLPVLTVPKQPSCHYTSLSSLSHAFLCVKQCNAEPIMLPTLVKCINPVNSFRTKCDSIAGSLILINPSSFTHLISWISFPVPWPELQAAMKTTHLQKAPLLRHLLLFGKHSPEQQKHHNMMRVAGSWQLTGMVHIFVAAMQHHSQRWQDKKAIGGNIWQPQALQDVEQPSY